MTKIQHVSCPSLTRTVTGLCLAALAAAAGAAPGIPAGACPAGGDGFRSPSAVAHYVEARLAGLLGDTGREAEELRLAVAYDESSAELRAAHAEALLGLGRPEAAEAEARQAVACDGAGRAASTAHRLLGRILVGRKQPGPALAELRAAMAIESALAADGERGDPEAWRLAAGVQVGEHDLDGAEATLGAAVAALGSDGGGFRELGRTLLEGGDPARAGRALRRAVEVDVADLDGWRLLAQADEALHRRPEARADWLALLRLDPDSAEALLGLGRLALLDDDVAAGEEWLRRYLGVAGDGPEPQVRVAVDWLEARRPEEALQAARQGLAVAPGDARLLLVAGEALLDLRRWPEAADLLGQVRPGAGDLWFSARARLAWALSRDGRHEEALAALAPPLAARPGDPRLVTTQAGVLLRAGRASEAVDLLGELRADRARTGDQAARAEIELALADALVRAGRTGEAVAGLRRAVGEQPGDPALAYALGAALDDAGRPEEALAQMRAVLVLDPEHAEALNFIGYRYAEQGVNLAEADVLLQRALRAAPRSGHIVDSLGWLRLRQGDVPGSVALLEQAARLVGPDAAVLDHLGDAYRAAGRPSDAVAAWRRALANVGDQPPAEQVGLRAALERKLSAQATAGASPAPR